MRYGGCFPEGRMSDGEKRMSPKPKLPPLPKTRRETATNKPASSPAKPAATTPQSGAHDDGIGLLEVAGHVIEGVVHVAGGVFEGAGTACAHIGHAAGAC